ncbi:MAG: protein jag [Eubacteriales bacterium]|nr:protein jag [Eubacteriales bacterium]
MKIEKTAKTVNIAIDEALKELNTTIDKIEYEVIQEASKGFLGIFSKPAKVIIKLKEDEEQTEKQNKIQNNEQKITEKNVSENSIAKKIPKMVAEDEFKKDYKFNNLDKKDQKPVNENADKIAKKFLEDIFQKMKIDIEPDVKIGEKNNLIIKLKGNDIGVIIGKRGQTLDSLQYLVNLVINKGEFAYISVSIDTENYREKRKQALENLAVNLAKKVRKINRSVNLEPMNPYERRIIHYKLQNDKSVKTYSEGEEPFRYVVIAPKQFDKQ